MKQDHEDNHARDRELGMDRSISRRDFLNGVALGVGGLAAGSWWAGLDAQAAQFAQDAPGYYPPALTVSRPIGRRMARASCTNKGSRYHAIFWCWKCRSADQYRF